MASKAVVLGANYYIGLSTIQSLGRHGIAVAAVDYDREGAYAFHSRFCSEQLVAPHYRKDPEGFINFLVDYGSQQEDPPVLIPTADPYVKLMDTHLEELKEHFLLHDIEPGLYTRLMHKDSVHQLATQHGVRVPETVETDDEYFLEKVRDTIGYPCLVKPVLSPAFVRVFRQKMFTVDNEEELIEAVKKAHAHDLKVVAQRLIPGFDDHMYTFDAYLNQESQVTHWLTAQKLRQFPINFGASVYTRQRHVPELYEIGGRFLEAVNYKGFAEIEFKKDANTGEFYLIEVNVRMTNFNNLLVRAGFNAPLLTYRELTGQPLGEAAIDHHCNIVFWYAYEDLLAVRQYIRSGQLGLGEILASYVKPKAFAIWDPADPRPALAFIRSLLSDKLSRRSQREVAGRA